MNSFLQSVLRPAMIYLNIGTHELSELERVKLQRKQISEKLTLTNQDREMIKRLDETINMLSK